MEDSEPSGGREAPGVMAEGPGVESGDAEDCDVAGTHRADSTQNIFYVDKVNGNGILC